jgi:two-component system, LuxR family, response regulator FixJ
VVPVYIIDDDKAVRFALAMHCRAMEVDARPFASAADFLDEVEFLAPGAVIVDLRMPEISGIDLLAAMRQRDLFWPVIVITGHGDIAAAVQAMKLGAVDFLQKPFSDQDFEEAIRTCAEKLPEGIRQSIRARASRKAMATLSPRERDVLQGVVSGQTSKEIAAQLGLSHRTVESYRVTMMAKLGAQRLHDLLAIASAYRTDHP